MSFLLIGLDDQLAGGAGCRAAGPARDRRRRARDARRIRVPHRRRPAPPTCKASSRSDPTSTTAQVGLVLVLIGAFASRRSSRSTSGCRGDGRADARHRVPALGDDGERRCADRRPLRARLRASWTGGVRCSSPSAASRWCWVVSRRCAGTTPSSCWPSAPCRSSGLMVVVFGVGDAAKRPRREWCLLVAHALFKSGLFLTDRRGRARDRQPATCAGSPASAVRLPWLAGAAALCTDVDDRPSTAARVPRQGISARGARARWRLGDRRARRRRRRVGADGGVLDPGVLGALRHQARRRRRRDGRTTRRAGLLTGSDRRCWRRCRSLGRDLRVHVRFPARRSPRSRWIAPRT